MTWEPWSQTPLDAPQRQPRLLGQLRAAEACFWESALQGLQCCTRPFIVHHHSTDSYCSADLLTEECRSGSRQAADTLQQQSQAVVSHECHAQVLKQLWPQEWWGITDCIKRQAEYVAEKTGYQVLVPDLYKGKLGVDAEEASHSEPAPTALLASSDSSSVTLHMTQQADALQ